MATQTPDLFNRLARQAAHDTPIIRQRRGWGSTAVVVLALETEWNRPRPSGGSARYYDYFSFRVPMYCCVAVYCCTSQARQANGDERNAGKTHSTSLSEHTPHLGFFRYTPCIGFFSLFGLSVLDIISSQSRSQHLQVTCIRTCIRGGRYISSKLIYDTPTPNCGRTGIIEGKKEEREGRREGAGVWKGGCTRKSS